MATNEQIQKALKSIGCNPYMNPESYRTIREVLQDALNPWESISDKHKDGNQYLLYNPKWDKAVLGRWREHDSGELSGWHLIDDSEYISGACEEGFIGWDDDIENRLMPTHILPPPPRDLPNPPEKIK